MHNPMIGRVTSHYDLRRKHPVFGSIQPHRGIDLGAPVGIKPHDYIGADIRAAYAGVVEQVCTIWNSGWGAIWGRSGCGVFIRNPDGEGQYYGHLSRVDVRKGQRVAKGEVIGGMGVSGNVTGPHLHFETHTGDSGPSNNYTRTRNPMTDFRAAGITPGVDKNPTIINVQSAAKAPTTTKTPANTSAPTSQEDEMTPAQLEELKEHVSFQIKQGSQWAVMGYNGDHAKKVHSDTRSGVQALQSQVQALANLVTELSSNAAPITREDVTALLQRVGDQAVELIASEYEITKKES